MEKSLFEQMGGTYSKVGDYSLPNLLLPQEETKPIGLWGQRHARYLKRSHKVLYMNLLTSGRLNNYLADIDEQAADMFPLRSGWPGQPPARRTRCRSARKLTAQCTAGRDSP